MLALVRDLSGRSGQTVILVTHHPDDAQLAANKTALVHEGKIAQSGPTEELFANPSEALRFYLG